MSDTTEQKESALRGLLLGVKKWVDHERRTVLGQEVLCLSQWQVGLVESLEEHLVGQGSLRKRMVQLVLDILRLGKVAIGLLGLDVASPRHCLSEAGWLGCSNARCNCQFVGVVGLRSGSALDEDKFVLLQFLDGCAGSVHRILLVELRS